MAAQSQDDFVDLYEILELPTDAESEPIRQRLNTLYLEAQQNLDHRNAKKRLQYQQMYEVYLPQARHLLLDKNRRAEYDRYLAAYRTGDKVAPSAKEEREMPMPSETVVEEPPLPGMAEVDPVVLAAEREDIWAKWKQGLEIVGETDNEAIEESAPQLEPEIAAPEETQVAAGSTPTTPSLPPFARRRPAPPQRPSADKARPVLPPRASGNSPTRPVPTGAAPSRPTPQRPAPPRPPSRTPSIGGRGIGTAAEMEAEAEAQREAARQEELEKQRFQITRDAVQNAGLLWGAAYAIGILIVGCILLFVLVNRIQNFPLGLSSGAFSGICLIVILAAALGGGFVARRKAKQRTAMELSMLPIEQLLRRSRS